MAEIQNPFNNDLPNQLASIIDGIDYKPRICQCIQACNEEAMIEQCMLQLYDQVDKILVIEGAVQNKVDAEQATPDGHSLDRTVEIIKDVKANKDPDKKIVFIQITRPWKDLEELKTTFFQYMKDGDWMLITDVDEFIMPEVVGKLRKAIDLEPWATEIVPAGFYHFWRDAWHMRKPDGNWGQQHQRFIRFQPGLNYPTHPIARDKDNICTYFAPQYLPRRFVLSDFVVYHYSYCRDSDEDVTRKKAFYEKELGQAKHADAGAYERGGQTDEYLNRSESMDDILLFDGEHPPAMANHPITQRRDLMLTQVDSMVEDPDECCNGYTSYKEVEPYNLAPEEMGVVWIWMNVEKRIAMFTNYIEI